MDKLNPNVLPFALVIRNSDCDVYGVLAHGMQYMYQLCKLIIALYYCILLVLCNNPIFRA